MPAHRILLTVGVEPFAVFVTLVGGNGDDGTRMTGAADRIQQMGGAHDICGEGFERNLVGEADERLSGEVEDDLRLA